MARVIRLETAKRDLTAHFLYLAEHASLTVADRFLANAQATFATLATAPLIGKSVEFKKRDLADVRLWHVRGFEKYLILYRPRAEEQVG